MRKRAKSLITILGALCAVAASAQIPDTASSLESGAAADGAGGAFHVTNADTQSGYWNPAGLGYVNTRQVGITYRHAAASRTRVTGTYQAPVRETDQETGPGEITHIGVTLPAAQIKKGAEGTIGISYTRGGEVDDVATGPANGLPDVAAPIRNYVERRKLKVDFVTVAYGTTNKSQNLAMGAGIVVAQAKVGYSESGTPVPGTWAPTSVSSNGTGVGVIAGLQYVPPKSPNTSFGISYRSEINLSGNSSTSRLYDKVPSRLVIGAASRRDGFRGGKDYLVYGVQFERYGAGTRSAKLDRKAQSGFGIGVEYHYSLGSGDLPLRLGYRSVESGGNDFGSRNAITYGIGYQPRDKAYSVDLSFSQAGGKTSFGLGATFRFK
jgi:long-subunit fatty acid transport protein